MKKLMILIVLGGMALGLTGCSSEPEAGQKPAEKKAPGDPSAP